MVSTIALFDTGHEDIIHDAILDYYGTQLATCGSDHAIKIFDMSNGTQTLTATLKGHYGPVWQLAWSHPKYGNLLASCAYDRKVIIWRNNGEWVKLYEYAGHDSSVNSLSWAPYEFGLILACGSSDGALSILTATSDITVWDIKKIPNAHTIGCNAVSWCPSTPISPAFDARSTNEVVRRIVSGGCDNLVKIWKDDGDRWIEEAKLEVHSDWVRDVAWAPSVGLPRSLIASASQDRRVVIWSSEDNANWTPIILNTFDDVVWNVSWSLTGNILAVSGGDNKVSLWRENNEGQWSCISEVTKGQTVNSEQRAL